MDPIGWFIATLHQMLGHGKAAAVLGVPAGDKAACIICQYERSPSEAGRRAVIAALAPVPVEGGTE
jgi:hypothetical protein